MEEHGQLHPLGTGHTTTPRTDKQPTNQPNKTKQSIYRECACYLLGDLLGQLDARSGGVGREHPVATLGDVHVGVTIGQLVGRGRHQRPASPTAPHGHGAALEQEQHAGPSRKHRVLNVTPLRRLQYRQFNGGGAGGGG